ncbi:adenylate/guanylate cyclase domain-containing protein [Pseudonocardia acidicola]|uniref:adenylate/guanylate cyclase domain-containing protein n=1 Tax=Pseudonocardia acidicola TaxID=2724939 RepID=UPI0030845B55
MSADPPNWLDALDELLDAANRGEVRRLDESLPLAAALEEIVLGAPRRYTRPEVIERASLDLEEGRRLWRSLGFPEVGDSDVLFTERDIEAARLMSQLTEVGILAPDVREAVARAVAQAMSRLAEWQVGMLTQLVADQADGVSPQQSLELASAILPTLETLQTYIWRRHLAATVSRVVVGRDADDTWPLTVGFADMVGFTRTTRRRSTTELSEMIERFGSSTTDVIAEGRGRIIKTVGDEVLFVADDIADAAAIALALQDRVRAEPSLPALRIGLAAGDVLVRFGDVYGEVVNIAARLTTHARPDSVLVDRAVATALADDPRFQIRQLRPLNVRGYRHLQPFLLRRGEHPGSPT